MTRRISNVSQVLQYQASSGTDCLPFRQAPHNIEAEQALLGAILINNDAYERVSDQLAP
jgi:replicative DNA helicase